MFSQTRDSSTPKPARTNLGRYAGAAPPKRTKLPPHPIRAVGSMERKYQETLGEIKKLEAAEYEWTGREGYQLSEKWWRDRLSLLNTVLMALEKSIRMFDPKWERKPLMVPKITSKVPPIIPKGECQKALIQILRSAPGPLFVKEIAEHVAARFQLPIERRDQRQRLWGMVNNSLRANYEKGRVDRKGSPARWFAV